MKNIKIEVSIKVTEEKGFGYDSRAIGECTLATKSDVRPDDVLRELDGQINEAHKRVIERLAPALKAALDKELREEARRAEAAEAKSAANF